MSSPIDPELLAPVLSPGLGDALTLPATAYTSDDVFAWETRRFFESGWVCLGRATDVAGTGDQAAFRVGQEGVLVVRGDDGRLRGFFNTCRHRGHELMEPGERRSLRGIKCPYHAWVYRLDGTLGAAPRFGDVEGFDTGDYPLIGARVDTWRGWVFTNVEDDAPPLAEAVGGLDELVAPWEPERLRTAASHTYDVAANWKTITENYHECYHCPSIHPELCVVTPPDSGANAAHDGLWVGGSMTLQDTAQTMSLTGASGGIRLRGVSDGLAREVHYYGLFPNLLVSLHPDYVMAHRIEPIAPGRTRIECEWLFPPEAWEVEGFSPDYATEFWDLTNRQDWRACESVHRGLAGAGFRQGPFAWTEDEVHAYMAMVARGYLEGRATTPPQVDNPAAGVPR